MPVSELRARLGIRELPDEERSRYNTVAGLLMAVSGHLPEVGEHIDCAGWCFEIVALEGRRIDRVLASPDPAAPPRKTEARAMLSLLAPAARNVPRRCRAPPAGAR